MSPMQPTNHLGRQRPGPSFDTKHNSLRFASPSSSFSNDGDCRSVYGTASIESYNSRNINRSSSPYHRNTPTRNGGIYSNSISVDNDVSEHSNGYIHPITSNVYVPQPSNTTISVSSFNKWLSNNHAKKEELLQKVVMIT